VVLRACPVARGAPPPPPTPGVVCRPLLVSGPDSDSDESLAGVLQEKVSGFVLRASWMCAGDHPERAGTWVTTDGAGGLKRACERRLAFKGPGRLHRRGREGWRGGGGADTRPPEAGKDWRLSAAADRELDFCPPAAIGARQVRLGDAHKPLPFRARRKGLREGAHKPRQRPRRRAQSCAGRAHGYASLAVGRVQARRASRIAGSRAGRRRRNFAGEGGLCPRDAGDACRGGRRVRRPYREGARRDNGPVADGGATPEVARPGRRGWRARRPVVRLMIERETNGPE